MIHALSLRQVQERTWDLITHTRMRIFRDCQRKHHYRYNEGVESLSTPHAMRFGSLIHRALEVWWSSEKDVEAALAAVQGVELDPFDVARAEALVAGYHARWADQTFEVLAVEAPFEAPLLNPSTGRRSLNWRIAGKLDAVVRDAGRVRIVEHKTTSEDLSPGSDYWKRLRLDGQVSVYFDGARSLGYDAEDCLYDVIGKPALRPGAKETPEAFRSRVAEALLSDPARYYGRAPVVRLERELAEARWDVWQIARAIRAGQLADHAPRNPEACARYRGQLCTYFPVCTGETTLEDRTLFRVLNNVSPELA